MADVVRWLDDLGLGQYAEAFAENFVDFDTLPQLTPEDLEGLGVTAIGHRRKLLTAIESLRNDTAEDIDAAEPTAIRSLRRCPMTVRPRRSGARSIVSIAVENRARSLRPASPRLASRLLIRFTSAGLKGSRCPVALPLFQGWCFLFRIFFLATDPNSSIWVRC